MLQERFYPGWAPSVRAWWNRGKNRIILFWLMALLATIIVVIVITTDWIRWDYFNASFLATNEVSRAFLASFILVMDLLIVMQVSLGNHPITIRVRVHGELNQMGCVDDEISFRYLDSIIKALIRNRIAMI